MELLSYSNLTKSEERIIKNFLNEIEIVDINTKIKQQTIYFRQNYKLKLPDALIAATAYFKDATLLTFDKRLQKIKGINILEIK
ncbi:MAG: PIN domain-containing protein [Bacteroidota bacterium]